VPHPAPHLRRFVRRVHRRLVLLRMVESAGVGLLAGSALAIALVGLLIWLERPALPAALSLLGAGAALGAVAGFARRPAAIGAALRADEQFGLQDLLSTALLVSRAPPTDAQPWAGVVLAAADARCATLSPSAVLVRRFGGRAWGGIGVAAGLALTFAAFSPGLADARVGGDAAVERGPTTIAQLPALPPLPPADASRVGAEPARRRTWSDPEERGRSVGGDVATERAWDAGANSPEGVDADRTAAGSSDATGGGLSSSDNPARRTDPLAPPGVAGKSTRPSANSSATPAGGGGSGSRDVGEREPGLGGSGGASAAAPAAPPWRSTDWPHDVDAARAALRAGRVPDAYRDVVRDYFERP
jgi:hypothetical protein